MKRLLDTISPVLRFVITTLFAILIIPVTMQIIARDSDYIPRYIWTEEIARFCFIWIIMIGAMIAVREDSHFAVDVLRQPRTRAGHGWAKLIVHLPMLLMALCFIAYGKQFADQGAMQTSEIAALPMVTIYIAWPLAGVIWTLFLVEKLMEDVKNIRGDGMPADNETHPIAENVRE
jgi:TRAP-type C4-dicarboxylate transport system permease small subunit